MRRLFLIARQACAGAGAVWRIGVSPPGLILAIAAALVLVGCTRDIPWQFIPNADDSARWWISPDHNRSLIVDRTSGEARYFDNTRPSFRFTYTVTGIDREWRAAVQDGLFWVGSNTLIGVSVYHRDELPGRGEQAILNRAAAMLERGHRQLFGDVTVTVKPCQIAGLNAVTWDAVWETTVEGQRSHVKDYKTLVEYGTEWVVQITAAGTEDDSVAAERIMSSFRSTDATDGFWPEMRRMLDDLGGFADAVARFRRP
jgi:hypothetical protein